MCCLSIGLHNHKFWAATTILCSVFHLPELHHSSTLASDSHHCQLEQRPSVDLKFVQRDLECAMQTVLWPSLLWMNWRRCVRLYIGFGWLHASPGPRLIWLCWGFALAMDMEIYWSEHSCGMEAKLQFSAQRTETRVNLLRPISV